VEINKETAGNQVFGRAGFIFSVAQSILSSLNESTLFPRKGLGFNGLLSRPILGSKSL